MTLQGMGEVSVYLNAVAALSPQCFDLWMHLLDRPERGISVLEASHLYRIAPTAVPRRMADLREAMAPFGWSIEKEMRTDPTGRRYARYFAVLNEAEKVAQ